MSTCLHCRHSLGLARAGARYCSHACRQAAYRARIKHAATNPTPPTRPASAPITDELRNRRRWTRAAGKRPITTAGSPASSTRAYTWTDYDHARRSTAGDGLGIMLGGGLGCWDLDHCLTDTGELTPEAAGIVASIAAPIVYAEVSVSGRGLHVFTREPEAPGIERPWGGHYTRARFIRVTGNSWTAPSAP